MRKSRNDPLMWAAARLHCVLGRHAVNRERRGDEQFGAAISTLVLHQGEVTRHWRRACKAAYHSWHAAAAVERRAVVELVRSTNYYVEDVLGQRPAESRPAPALRDLAGELRQLEDEFGDVTIQFRPPLIAIVTTPITLEGVGLGRFQISLQLERFAERQDVTAFDCIALDPNPAAASEETTHPHVRGGVLCAGEASVPLAASLREGRVCDAFLLINSVLNTYNPASPYVSLDDWSGVACCDCGRTCDPEWTYRCRGCDDDVCEDCIGSCDACAESHCLRCLERERGDGDYLCAGCRTTCPRCGLVASIADVEERGTCHACDQEQQDEERDRERQLEQQEQEQTHDDIDESGGRATTTAAGTSGQAEATGPAVDASAA